jgi:hypothetical protein
MENKLELLGGNQDARKSVESFDFNAFFLKAKELPCGEPMTYGATPLDRMTTLQQQLELAINLQELTYRDIPDDVPLEIIDYVHSTFVSRFHSRGEANEENYMTSLSKGEEYDQDVQAMFERGEHGKASASELLLTRYLRGIRSVELACLTHPYGKRIDPLLAEMRSTVQQHAELLGGVYFDEPETRYRVKEILSFDNGEKRFDKGLLMTRKRTLGYMPDGTVIRERSSFVLRLDNQSPFTEAEIEALSNVDLSRPDWQDELVKVGNLNNVVAMLLEMDEYSLAIPISTTIYAYNLETARVIEERNAKELARRRAKFAREHPFLSAAMKLELNNKVTEERNGMYYVGPSEPPAEPYAETDNA